MEMILVPRPPCRRAVPLTVTTAQSRRGKQPDGFRDLVGAGAEMPLLSVLKL